MSVERRWEDRQVARTRLRKCADGNELRGELEALRSAQNRGRDELTLADAEYLELIARRA